MSTSAAALDHTGHMRLRRNFGVDTALHNGLCIFSIAAEATSGTFVYARAPPWVFSCTLAITTITVIYSACYVYVYAGQSRSMSVKALVILALFWCLALILPWMFVPYAVYKTALFTEWTPLAQVAILFCSLSIAILAIVPPASYYRYKLDTALDGQQEPSSHPIAGPPNKHNTILAIAEHDPDGYMLCELLWCQGNDLLSHQFIILIFDNGVHKLYVRVERQTDTLKPVGALETWVKSALSEEVLTTQSVCVARYTVDPIRSQQSKRTITSIGDVIEKINQHYSNYCLFSYNCWWFASCSFICIVYLIEPDRPRIYRCGESHQLTIEEAMAFCQTHYLSSHWSYWILVGHPLVVFTAGLSLISNWFYLAYTIPPVFMAAWLMYYIVSIARSWEMVRGVGCRYQNVVGVGIAYRAVIVAVGLMSYGIVFLALALNHSLAITKQTKSGGSYVI
ncbi:hypothetical protein FRB93_004628 [Tulasnella sp. JGI-2019a]|nr:hypothetical protein FRB93_004628 [Tulasnella sp. JGI-2019a]